MFRRRLRYRKQSAPCLRFGEPKLRKRATGSRRSLQNPLLKSPNRTVSNRKDRMCHQSDHIEESKRLIWTRQGPPALTFRQQRFQGTNHVVGTRNINKTTQKKYCCDDKNSAGQCIQLKIADDQSKHDVQAPMGQYCMEITLTSTAVSKQ